MDKVIVGLSGSKQSGKSTIAEYLLNNLNMLNNFHDLNVSVCSFADPLKRFLIDVLGLSEERC